MRVEIGYTYTKGGGFTLGRIFTADVPPAWVMEAFPNFIPAKDVSDIDNAIDKGGGRERTNRRMQTRSTHGFYAVIYRCSPQ